MQTHRDDRLIYGLVFMSGFAALVYEISWTRQIGLLFGHTTHAAAIVLAGYFLGMAVGYRVGGRWAKRVAPLLGYAACEALVAVWAIAIPWLLDLAHIPELHGWLHVEHGGWRVAARGVFVLVLLGPATCALGATLPFLAEYFGDSDNLLNKGSDPSQQAPIAEQDPTVERVRPLVQQAADRGASRLNVAYAWNTIGALAGVVIAAAVLLVSVGVRSSSYLAAAISLLCAAVAASRKSSVENSGESPELSPSMSENRAEQTVDKERGIGFQPVSLPETQTGWKPIPRFSTGCYAAASGFGTLALEVLYTRMFSLVLHNSTHTFAIVIAVFLLGLALGSLLCGWLIRRASRSRPDSQLLVIHGAAAVGGFLITASVVVFVWWTRLEYFPLGTTFIGYLARVLGLATVVMLPAATALGIILPATWGLLVETHRAGSVSAQSAGRNVGDLTMINTLAAASGSMCASFVLLPVLGLWFSFAAVAALFGVLPLFRGLQRRNRGSLLLGVCVVLATFPLWPGTTHRTIPTASSRPLVEAWVTPLPHEQILRRWETDYGWIDVTKDDRGGALRIRQNRHYSYGSTGSDSAREQRQAHLPILLHPHPREVLCLGLGTGLTAAGTLPHPEVERTTIVELIPEVVAAARLLTQGNAGVVDHPKVQVVVDDARHYLTATEQKFDVIVADLFVPWESSTGYLYTVEHYQSARDHLHADGVFCQWLALYQVGPREFELIADSFASVFPNTTLWWGHVSADRPIMAFIGTNAPLQIQGAKINDRLIRLRESGRFSDPLLTDATALYELWLGDWQSRPAALLNTNEHPRVEFWTPIAHGDRALLRRRTLRTFHDTVLSQLPRQAVRIDQLPTQTPPRDVKWQRTVLFPE